jgi:hypothetical protein
MSWEYKIIVQKVLKGQTSLRFDTDDAARLLNEAGLGDWELVDVLIVGTEAMFTLKRPRKEIAEGESLWK